MKLWPFGNKLETRDDSYSDVLIAALVSRAQGRSLAVPSGNGGAWRRARGLPWGAALRLCGSHGPGLPDQGLDACHVLETDRPLAH